MSNVAILMLTHNAPSYVWKSLTSLRAHTERERAKVVVVDNASGLKTRYLLRICKLLGYIDVLVLNSENSLFAGGNNIAARHAPKECDTFLLLNSDVEVRSARWLDGLADVMDDESVGAVAYGACLNEPIRADGYCFMVRRELFEKHQMDENFQWFWSMTKFEAQILEEGFDIVAFQDHESMLHHFGGASGGDWQGAKGMDVDPAEVLSWFTDTEDGSHGRMRVVPTVDSQHDAGK